MWEQAPKALVKVLLEVLREAGPALLVANMETRRPELLDIRPLPQYSSLAEALKVPPSLPLLLSACLLAWLAGGSFVVLLLIHSGSHSLAR